MVNEDVVNEDAECAGEAYENIVLCSINPPTKFNLDKLEVLPLNTTKPKYIQATAPYLGKLDSILGSPSFNNSIRVSFIRK